MFVDRSRRTWQISGEALDCLSRQINQEWVTVMEPFCRSLLLYFMLSSLLFSLRQDTNLFHQWFSCWPCRLVYLQPPLSFSSYEVISVMRRNMGKTTQEVIGNRSVIGRIIVQRTWHLLSKKHKKELHPRNAVYKLLLEEKWWPGVQRLLFKNDYSFYSTTVLSVKSRR